MSYRFIYVRRESKNPESDEVQLRTSAKLNETVTESILNLVLRNLPAVIVLDWNSFNLET